MVIMNIAALNRVPENCCASADNGMKTSDSEASCAVLSRSSAALTLWIRLNVEGEMTELYVVRLGLWVLAVVLTDEDVREVPSRLLSTGNKAAFILLNQDSFVGIDDEEDL
jgi:hypothetical protein